MRRHPFQIRPGSVRLDSLPGKVTYLERPLVPGEAVNQRRIWGGRPKWRCTVVLYGQLDIVSIKSRAGNPYHRTKLRAGSCTVQLRWFADVVPPGLKTGDPCIILGKLITANQGKAYQIFDAVCIKGPQRRHFRYALLDTFARYSFAPKEYMDLPIRYRVDEALAKE